MAFHYFELNTQTLQITLKCVFYISSGVWPALQEKRRKAIVRQQQIMHNRSLLGLYSALPFRRCSAGDAGNVQTELEVR